MPKESIKVRIAAGDARAPAHGDRLEHRRRIAPSPQRIENEPLQRALPTPSETRGALHRVQRCPYPNDPQIIAHRLPEGEKVRQWGERAGIEPLRVPCLREQLLGALRVVRMWRHIESEGEFWRHDTARQARISQRLRGVDFLAVDGQTRG